MGRKRHTEEQTIGVLKEGEAGLRVADICRKHGINDAIQVEVQIWRDGDQ